MKYLHTMVRVTDLDESLRFYRDILGLRETRRTDNEKGRYTLVFLAPDGQEEAPIELTYNWDPEDYDGGRNFGHLAYEVEDIYDFCQKVMDAGITINRPPRDGRMAFIRSPDKVSIEILQEGDALPPQEPWASMPNTGASRVRAMPRMTPFESTTETDTRAGPPTGWRICARVRFATASASARIVRTSAAVSAFAPSVPAIGR